MRYSDLISTRLNEFQNLTNQQPIDKRVLDELIKISLEFIKPKDYFLQVKKYIESLGWEWKGKGGYGFVAQPPNQQYVIKFWKKDRGYEAAIKIFANNQKEPHFPKVYMYHILDQGPGFGFAVLENLMPLDSSLDEYINFLISDNITPNDSIKDIKEKFLKFINIRQQIDSNIVVNMEKINPYFNQLISLHNALLKLISFNSGFLIDINVTCNFMTRHDGTIVIIDPYYDEENPA